MRLFLKDIQTQMVVCYLTETEAIVEVEPPDNHARKTSFIKMRARFGDSEICNDNNSRNRDFQNRLYPVHKTHTERRRIPRPTNEILQRCPLFAVNLHHALPRAPRIPLLPERSFAPHLGPPSHRYLANDCVLLHELCQLGVERRAVSVLFVVTVAELALDDGIRKQREEHFHEIRTRRGKKVGPVLRRQ